MFFFSLVFLSKQHNLLDRRVISYVGLDISVGIEARLHCFEGLSRSGAAEESEPEALLGLCGVNFRRIVSRWLKLRLLRWWRDHYKDVGAVA